VCGDRESCSRGVCARAMEVLESEEWSVCVRGSRFVGSECVCEVNKSRGSPRSQVCVRCSKSLQVLREGGVMCACEGVCVRGCVCARVCVCEGNERLGV